MRVAIASLVLMWALVACDSGVFTTPSTGELIEPDAAYEIDTWGANSEVYEFTPKGNPKMTCVVFILDSLNATGMQCIPTAKK